MSWLQALHQGEQGASLALVALSLAGLLVMVAQVADLGGTWLLRQTLAGAADAAALAAAQDLVDRPWDIDRACAIAGSYVTGNAPAATMTSCEVVASGADQGRVAITAAETLEPNFATPGGDGGIEVSATATAAWGPPLAVSGLRPLGLCYHATPQLQGLIDEPLPYPIWVDVPFYGHDPAACTNSGALGGNFVTLDFEGGTGLYEIGRWMRDGYPEPVRFGDPAVASCDAGTPCYDRPYALLHLTSQLSTLRYRRTYVALPLYNYADAAAVHVVGAIRARIYAFDLSGSPENWSLQLKVQPGLLAGTCCGAAGLSSGIHSSNGVIALCGVDPGASAACEPDA